MNKFKHPFVKYVKQECKRIGCKLIFRKSHEFKDEDGSCTGYFIDDPLELGVATKGKYHDFLETLVHEFSHLEQWRENSPFYIAGYRGLDSWTVLSKWLSGQEYKRKTVKKCLDIIRDCELDCDRKAVVNIKKFNIPIDVKAYSKKQSAYAYFHNFMKKSRKWEYKEYATGVPQIVKKMPDNLDGDYSKTPRRIMRLFDRHMK